MRTDAGSIAFTATDIHWNQTHGISSLAMQRWNGHVAKPGRNLENSDARMQVVPSDRKILLD